MPGLSGLGTGISDPAPALDTRSQSGGQRARWLEGKARARMQAAGATEVCPGSPGEAHGAPGWPGTEAWEWGAGDPILSRCPLQRQTMALPTARPRLGSCGTSALGSFLFLLFSLGGY